MAPSPQRPLTPTADEADRDDGPIDPRQITPKVKKLRQRYLPKRDDPETMKQLAEAIRKMMHEDRP